MARQARIWTLVVIVALPGSRLIDAPEQGVGPDLAVDVAAAASGGDSAPGTLHSGAVVPAVTVHALTDDFSPARDDESPLPAQPGSLAMDDGQLAALLEQGFLDVLHPEGGLLRIDLLRLEQVGSVRTLHIESAGLRGVITERLGNYFATIATPSGVYALQRRDGHTELANQQQLDLRSNPDQRDYRHAPLA